MQIQIESSCLGESHGSRTALEQRARIALRRMHDKVQQVRISLRDINGPRGGVDKQCLLVLNLDGHGTLVVTAQANSASRALNSALKRASQSLARLWQQRHRPIRGLSQSDFLGLKAVA